jgi:hypothetical protein
MDLKNLNLASAASGTSVLENKPGYMHRNPVKCGLVDSSELWMWNSFRYYRFGETGLVKVRPEVVPVFAGSK